MSEEKRQNSRYIVPFYLSLEWIDKDGTLVISKGVTENIALNGVLAHLVRDLPQVGQIVKMTVTDEPFSLTVEAQVLRLERNAAHPQVALLVIDSPAEWEETIWQRAKDFVENEKPETYQDWFP